RPRPLTTSSSPQLPIRCRQPTHFGARQPLVPDGSQPLLQIEHRVALAREQRVETHSRARRQLLEADALDLVRHEYLALLRRQLRERRLGGIGERCANEGEEAPALAPHRRGNLAVLVAGAQARSERSIHLSVKTLGRGGYCGGSPPRGLPLTSSTATAAPACRSVPP